MTIYADQREIDDQALVWIIRVRDHDFYGWDEFEGWLSICPEHAEAYHRLAIEDRALEDILTALEPVRLASAKPSAVRRWAWPALGAGIAAMLVAVLSIHMSAGSSSRFRIETRPGERRTLALQGGTTILLNGESALILDHKNPRFAALQRGEALFSVVHDPAHPFAVQVGEGQLVDVGTRFDVTRTQREMRVAVAEGSIVYNPATQALALKQGDLLRVSSNGVTAVRSRVASEEVGAWRQGRFVYAGEPLSRVAEDLSRYSGAKVEVSPDIAGQPFRGVISITNPAKFEELGPLFRAHVERRGGGWLISRH